MRKAVLAACVAITVSLVAACVPVAYKPIVPSHEPRNGDIQVSTQSHRERKARPEAAAECAQYGRVARHRSGNDYDCVSPQEATNE